MKLPDMKTQHPITKAHLENGLSYSAYKQLMDDLIREGKATGGHDSEAMLNYSILNQARMARIEKTFSLDPELEKQLKNISSEQIWVVLSEGWCGDAAQNVPILAAFAEASPKIELKILLRDENPEIMDAYLTEGGRSIPKLIILRKGDLSEMGTWGPRPEPAQEMVRSHKKDPQEPYGEFVKKVQGWYNKDKNQTIQQEFKALLKNWN